MIGGTFIKNRLSRLRKRAVLTFWITFFLVSIVRNLPSNYERAFGYGTRRDPSLTEVMPVQINIGSVHQSTSQYEYQDRTNQSLELSVNEAIGYMKLEQTLARFNPNQFVFKTPKKIKKIFLIASWRTGSSFLAEVIRSSPGVFYSFEPLHFLEFYKPKPSTKSMEFIRSIFNCRFTADYLEHISKPENEYILMNPRVKEACRYDKNLCTEPDFVRRLCVHFPIQLVKEVRLTLNEIEEDGLMDSPNLELNGEWKVIYLVRDPRAVMSSRTTLGWCNLNEDCKNVTHLCRGMEKDLSNFESLQARNPERYNLIKYEDFASNVEEGTQKLFDFLGIPVTTQVRVFLDTHTKNADQTVYAHSTRRFSKNVVNAWRDKLSQNRSKEITATCSKLLQNLGYPLSYKTNVVESTTTTMASVDGDFGEFGEYGFL